MENVKVKIEGASALLMHAFPIQPVAALEKKTPEEQAEFAAYRTARGELYVPGVAIQRALISGAAYSKGKGRASLTRVVAACVGVYPEQVLMDGATYQVDSRPVVVPATKGRVMRHRPRFDKWRLEFLLEYDQELITRDQLHRVICDTGSRVGLLDFRPEGSGSISLHAAFGI